MKKDPLRDLFEKAMRNAEKKSCNHACKEEGARFEITIKVLGCSNSDCPSTVITDIEDLVVFAKTTEGVSTKLHGSIEFQSLAQSLLNARIIRNIMHIELLGEMTNPIDELMSLLKNKN